MENNALYKLLQIAKPSKLKIVGAVIASALNKICDIVPEILIGIAIDVIVNQQHSIIAKLGIINPYSQLYLVAGATAFFWIFESVFEYLYAIMWRSLAQDIQHTLRLKTYTQLQNADLEFFENKRQGELLNILQDDINQLEAFLSQGPNEIIQLLVNIVGMGAIFFYVSPMLAITAIAPIPFVIAIAYYFQKKLAYLYNIVRQVSSSLASHLAHRLQGITTIQSYTTQHYELKLLETESKTYQNAHYKASKINAAYIPIVRMSIMVGFIASLVVGGMLALQGKVPINWYAALVFLTQRFLWPFTTLTTITDLYEKANACAQRILNILQTTAKIQDGTAHHKLDLSSGAITFENSSFAYANGAQIFKSLSLAIPARNIVAFVGSTGSGKSTLIKLLLRFYDLQQGRILINNIDITSFKLNDLRTLIGLVSQDVYIVQGTIADNIAYGSFNATKQDITDAAKKAHAHDFIMQLPSGYDTVLQENGKNLSGGQRQRLSIARAILKKAPILIFDEATSAVDNETESIIAQSIIELGKSHTIIMIAHRLSTVRHADTIYVLDKGNIIEYGNHIELIGKHGAYANLWNLQQGKAKVI